MIQFNVTVPCPCCGKLLNIFNDPLCHPDGDEVIIIGAVDTVQYVSFEEDKDATKPL